MVVYNNTDIMSYGVNKVGSTSLGITVKTTRKCNLGVQSLVRLPWVSLYKQRENAAWGKTTGWTSLDITAKTTRKGDLGSNVWLDILEYHCKNSDKMQFRVQNLVRHPWTPL